MAFSAPLQLVSPQGQRPAVYDVGGPSAPPVSALPGGVPMATYQPGVGFFEGPLSGNPESITGQMNPPSTPGGPSGIPGAPSAPSGATPTPGSGAALASLGGIQGLVGLAGQNTLAARLGQQIGAGPTLSNFGAGLMSSALGPVGAGLNLANTISGIVGAVQAVNALNQNINNPALTMGIPEDVSPSIAPFDQPVDLQAFTQVPAPAQNVGQNVGIGSPEAGFSINTTTGAITNAQGQVVGQSHFGGVPTPVPTAPAPPGPPTPPAEPPEFNDPNAPGGGAVGGEDKVICDELHRQGLMDDETWARDEAFGRSLPPEVRAGYLRWAPTVVGWMRRWPVLTPIVWFIARPWAREMAYGDSLIGRIIMRVGWVMCARLGRPVLA